MKVELEINDLGGFNRRLGELKDRLHSPVSTEELLEQALYVYWAGIVHGLDFNKQVSEAREAAIMKENEDRKQGRGR